MRRVVVCHGWTANPTKHWFPWLRDQLSEPGVEVLVPGLSSSENPSVNEWVDVLSDVIGIPDDNTKLSSVTA